MKVIFNSSYLFILVHQYFIEIRVEAFRVLCIVFLSFCPDLSLIIHLRSNSFILVQWNLPEQTQYQCCIKVKFQKVALLSQISLCVQLYKCIFLFFLLWCIHFMYEHQIKGWRDSLFQFIFKSTLIMSFVFTDQASQHSPSVFLSYCHLVILSFSFLSFYPSVFLSY